MVDSLMADSIIVTSSSVTTWNPLRNEWGIWRSHRVVSWVTNDYLQNWWRTEGVYNHYCALF